MANVTVINTGNLASLRTYNIGDDWEIFAERLEQYLKANKVEEERKVSVLITSISEEAYKTSKNLCDPVKPYEKSYADIVKLLDNQFKTKISIFRRQGAESINEWFVKVKKAAADCEFGTSLTERVKDKFVVGLKPGRVLDRLCEENPSRELQELLDIAVAKEAAIKESREVEVNKLNSLRGVKKTNPGTSSSKRDVKVREDGQNKTHQEKQKYTCSKCQKRGHIAAACNININKTHFIDNIDSDNDVVKSLTVDIFALNSVSTTYVKPVYVTILIDSKPIKMEVDTGAGLSCIPFEVYTKYLSHIKLEFSKVKELRYPPTDLLSGAFRQSAGPATDPAAQTQAKAQVYPGHSKVKESVADQPLPQADVPPASPGTNSEPVRKRVHVGVNSVVLLGFTVAVLRRYLSP
ncbi:hypothetical protein NQ315_008297 [Exocentrus adspersus]|uniref:Uncharacterized protein n=1 Tax=Exocentrus adspersus TaxID=1586481 RepID=A0AAV8VM80_9CUCU|nr:hypothetical protein NQ315_008297 [Exocentrus adspersus]